jgi:hypothetical protein
MTDQSDPNFLDDLAREVRTVSDRLDDLERQGLEAQLGLSTPARSGFDLSAMSLVQGVGEIVPAAVIADNAVTADSIVASAITTEKLDAGAITTDKLAAGAVTTAELNASAVIALVTNAGATVVIDASGIAVTGGAITVTNPGSVVIIDGTSNMFKIAATGTQQTTQVSGAGRSIGSTTLTALSGQSTSLALVAMVGAFNTASDQRGTSYVDTMPATHMITSSSGLTGSPVDDPFVSVINDNNTGSSKTAYQRYYLMKEAAI